MRAKRMLLVLAIVALTLAIPGARAQTLFGPNKIQFQSSLGFTAVQIPLDDPQGTAIYLPVTSGAVGTEGGDGGLAWLQQVYQVDLTIASTTSGSGYNGDITAELIAPGGQYAVLLNRSGMGCNGKNNNGVSGCNTSSLGQNSTFNTLGYADANGFTVSFVDPGKTTVGGSFGTGVSPLGNIHDYQSVSPGSVSGGAVSGVWSADGLNIQDQSNAEQYSAAFAAGPTQQLAAFTNGGSYKSESLGGTWELFVADSAAGSSMQVTGVNIYASGYVPAPPSFWIMGIGSMGLPLLRRARLYSRRAHSLRRDTKRKEAPSCSLNS